MSIQPTLPVMTTEPPAGDAAARSALLSGWGYYKLGEHRRRQLARIAAATLGVHLAGLALFGGYVVLSTMRDEPAIFTVPPPVRTYEPRQLEHKVRVQQRQRSSSRPSVVPRIVSTRVSDLALPEVTTDPKLVTSTFQPRFRAVSGRGLGAGLGTGYGTAGFGEGVSNIDFFGIQARGERIAIILDASVSMAEETEELGVTERGIAQYAMVKARVGRVIDALAPGTLFNVVVYAQTASVWRDEMQYATDLNKRQAREFIAPFNSTADWNRVGHTSGVSSLPYGLGSHASGGTTRFDLALSLALKGGADTVLVICDGDVWTTKAPSPEELRAHQAAMEAWQQRTASMQTQSSPAETRTERVWIEAQPAQEAVIRERGGRQARAATEGRWVERTVRVGGGGPRLPPRPSLPSGVWTLADYQRHIEALHEQFLKPRGRGLPVIHVIGFRSGREDSDFLRRLARAYRGQFRRVDRVR